MRFTMRAICALTVGVFVLRGIARLSISHTRVSDYRGQQPLDELMEGDHIGARVFAESASALGAGLLTPPHARPQVSPQPGASRRALACAAPSRPAVEAAA